MNDETDYIKLDVGKGYFYDLIRQISRNTYERKQELAFDDISEDRRKNLEDLLERNAYLKNWILRNTDSDGFVLLSTREFQGLFWLLVENNRMAYEDEDDDFYDEEDDEDDE